MVDLLLGTYRRHSVITSTSCQSELSMLGSSETMYTHIKNGITLHTIVTAPGLGIF